MTEWELDRLVAAVRVALARDPDAPIYSDLPPPADPARLVGLPGRLGEVLAVTDGPQCGTVICWRADQLPGKQFYTEEAGGERDWLCFGVNSDDPLYIARASGEVWWWDPQESGRFDGGRPSRLTDDVPAFFQQYVFGPGYLTIARPDQWWDALAAAGLVAGDS